MDVSMKVHIKWLTLIWRDDFIPTCLSRHYQQFTNRFSHLLTFHSFLGYAIPAVNCVSSSGINACLEAARKNDAPIIIQFSSGGSQVSPPLLRLIYSVCTLSELMSLMRQSFFICSFMLEKLLITKITPLPLPVPFREPSTFVPWPNNTVFQSSSTLITALSHSFPGLMDSSPPLSVTTPSTESLSFLHT